jgi:uncharacterized protein
MTLEVRANGVACQLGCTYCYQNPMRDAGNIKTLYDIDLLLGKVKEEKMKFTMFGGEPLLMPLNDLEQFFQYGFDTFETNNIQTNGALITPTHIKLFKKYNVTVGVSIDGPDELNDLRVYKNNLKSTREATQKTIDNMEQMVKEGIPVAVIFTLHKLNGSKENLPKLIDFIRYLGDIGITRGNVHMLEVDSALVRELYMLTEEENTEAMVTLARFMAQNPDLRYRPFEDIQQLMNFDDEDVQCTFRFCDPQNTQSVRGIEGNGDVSNCSRTNKEGIDFHKADDSGLQRYISLYNTPQEYGGCQGCPFFIMCSGHCPGEAIDGDSRNRTIHCQTLKALFSFYEQFLTEKGMNPLTKHQNYDRIVDIFMNGIYTNTILSFNDVRLQMNNNTFVPENCIVVPVWEG